MSLFSTVEMAPRDPILGLTEQYQADPNPAKVNLGVGVYLDDEGKLPLLQCVQAVEKSMEPKPHGYLPIDGMPAYCTAVKHLVFGKDSDSVTGGRVATIQSLGGTGGLKVGADFLRQQFPAAQILISDPSWENHRALFTRAGFAVGTYRYYDPDTHDVRFGDMLEDLRAAREGSIVLLHACCHNPTGCDLGPAQWDEVIGILRSRRLVPFLDMAYQGFSQGLQEDGAVVAKFAQSGLSFLVSTSFSKSFSLYGERVGALSVVCADRDEAARVLSQLKIAIRTNYSNPPTHGAAIVTSVLGQPELTAMWERELGEMRLRIRAMRQRLVEGLAASGVARDMQFITRQVGMFSYSGLNKEQMVRLRGEFGIYGTDAGRICVSALNGKNIDYVCACMAKVM
ncbi:aromatic amino acid transaminase [Candidatus Symbiobacter mobilis]|uniref:Aminotransferase n=1 Tax=Candidatus Symbiobacter mobilis CR TaxID=946483 RepID=U5N977_9BURK|nr:amino acid aminotransferase [Candidatus Symbiobacter mobilis]AGX88116.1 aromatic-amino-acid transaminase [Candidatus Symbiobacter mobilis CR]